MVVGTLTAENGEEAVALAGLTVRVTFSYGSLYA